MGFWNNVKTEIDFMNISRKELANRSKVPKYTIDKGIERDSEVSAIVAIKIAHALNLPLEYLLEIKLNQMPDDKKDDLKKLRLAEKYFLVLTNLEKIPKELREKIIALVNDMAKMKI